jgi:molecular chaperone IbpA
MFDLSPLYRSTVGFDRLFSLLDSAANVEASAPTFPPYNIERIAENEYRITMAVAGFGEDDINVEVKESTLTVTGKRADVKDAESKVLHQGIAARSFERRFQLADYVEVSGATLENGLLHLDLKREIPEAMKPRNIAITSGSQKQLEGKAA